MRAKLLSRVTLGFMATIFGAMVCADDLAFTEAASVADSTLDEIRGGFELPSNLRASMTLERTAYLNGELVAHLSVSIPDIGNITTSEATALAETAGMLLIQNGPGNTFDVADLGPASTVIQNTLNDQHLSTLTTISVDVNTLGAFREMNFQDGLRDSLVVPGVR